MKVSVTGAGGFIGSHLVNRLVTDGHEVRAADIKPYGEWNQELAASTILAGCDCSTANGADDVSGTAAEHLEDGQRTADGCGAGDA